MSIGNDQSRIEVSAEELEAFCSRWKILELSLFGSVIRDDFRPDSDVDVLVSFAGDAKKSFSGRMSMIDELQAIFGRKIDLVDRKLMDKPTANPLRRHANWNETKSLPVRSGFGIQPSRPPEATGTTILRSRCPTASQPARDRMWIHFSQTSR
ncbi:MAG: nucleotidyltransferase domain-containing protein [Methanothrix sp.]|jgi:hypothetical protein|nr:nucleotidyltransferase domain-containing protein [Methanothrix sp.]